MIRITIIADRVDELRQFLNKAAEDKPKTFKTLGDLQWPSGSYRPRRNGRFAGPTKEDRSR